MIPRIVAIEAQPGYVLKLTFSDGLVTEADMSMDLRGPMAEPLRDPEFFAKVRLDEQAGTICWPNGYDLDPLVLHGDLPAAEPSALRVKRLKRPSVSA